MKRGILTFHNVYNYGAILQAYALQRKLKEITGEPVEIIDYTNEVLKSKNPKNILQVKNIKDKIKYLIMRSDNKKIRKKFKDFFERNMEFSKKVYSKQNINETNSEFDSFIVGSDQVWNDKLNGNDSTFFLDFVKDEKKKNSYAASFGVNHITEEYRNKYAMLLNRFNNISVREENGLSLVREMVNKDADLVLDPTFLLTKEEWEELADNSNFKEKYILVYIVTLTPNILNYAKKLAEREGCKIICIHRSYKNYKGIKNIKDASIEEFLGYLKNAEYVLTTSYHGLILSLNLNKKVYFELAKAKQNYNSRLQTIVNTFDIQNLEIQENSTLEDKKIDYESINKILEEKRKVSIQFLRKL